LHSILKGAGPDTRDCRKKCCKNNFLAVQPLLLDRPDVMGYDGQVARLLVRPHDFAIHLRHNGSPGLRARVERVQPAGPRVRVELVAETGAAVMEDYAI